MNYVVKFNETEISAVKAEGEIFVALKPICGAIGLVWERQRRTINEHPILAAVLSIQTVPSAGGPQETVCLPLDFIPGWLFSINANQVSEAAHPALLVYQRECYRVLRDYFFGKPSEAAERFARIVALKTERKRLKKRIIAIDDEIRLLERVQMQLPFNQTEKTQA